MDRDSLQGSRETAQTGEACVDIHIPGPTSPSCFNLDQKPKYLPNQVLRTFLE